jgi:hypothetical protein
LEIGVGVINVDRFIVKDRTGRGFMIVKLQILVLTEEDPKKDMTDRR